MDHVGSYPMIVLALLVAVACLGTGVFISWLFRPHNPSPVKLEPYECGEPAVGPAQVQFKPLFYLVAIVFVVFDVEVVFLFPWAVVFRDLGWPAFVEMVVFIVILMLALVYAWRKGALSWRS